MVLARPGLSRSSDQERRRVELRGIEPRTSAVRLHELGRFFAAFRYFLAAKIEF